MTVKQVFNTSAELDYPTVLPTLDLDFANSKTLDPRITFTRTSGGSYVGADGLIKYAGVNEARFDHDPETGESLGLLIEEARTNLLLRSEEFNLWAITRSTIQSNAITAPDGTNTADKLVEDTTPNKNHIVFRSSLGLSSNVYTFSVYVKAAERNEIVLRIDTNVTQRNVRFNLVEGTIVNVGDVSARIEYVGNGWYRCINTMNIAEEVLNAVLMLADSRFPLSVVYTGDGTSGVYIWGAQLEEGAFPTSYIPTQASTRTRALDNARIIGKNFSDFYNQDEGTAFVEVFKSDITAGVALNFSDVGGFGNNRIQIGNTSQVAYVVNNVVVLSNTSATGIFDALKNKIATSYKLNDIIISTNGKYVTRPSRGITPQNMTTMTIGSYPGNSGKINNCISRVTYYPKFLSVSQHQALTS